MIAIYRIAEQAAAWAGKLGAFCALVAGLFTCLDIAMRNFGGQGILGTVDITQLMIVACAFLTIPYGFMTDSHVSIDIGIGWLPLRIQALCRAFAALLGGALMWAIGWFGIGQANTVALMGDRSQTIALPMIWFWYPLLAGSFFATLLIALIVLRHLAVAVTGRDIVPSAPKGEVL
ncbi:TRAP transporter small permease [Ferrovibrio terrae]|uniref:TRAP transporter small permease n=1 Tax=Ferrovibrio terrae TaxID=2594003 RepID=UPI0031381BCA